MYHSCHDYGDFRYCRLDFSASQAKWQRKINIIERFYFHDAIKILFRLAALNQSASADIRNWMEFPDLFKKEFSELKSNLRSISNFNQWRSSHNSQQDKHLNE